MKKNLIYTITFILCGAFFFSSCEDMLNVDSNRVEYEFDDWTFNDSVYSVLGILKSVQKVGDRHILLNELRGDLLATNNKTLDDVLDISNYDFDENNKYLDVKDYFSIINNCNVFLARVDTTLEYDNRRLMLREYVAVKSIRAWTYLQLMKNHAYIPYFTEPVLTHSKAEEIMTAAPTDHITLINKLIEDIAPYENPGVYQMPLWEIPNFVDKTMTGKLFMPIRVLLGDLYLWRASLKAETATYPLPNPNPNSDFAMAAKYYYEYLTDENSPRTDSRHTSTHSTEKPDDKNIAPGTGFLTRFLRTELTARANDMVSIIHYADNENVGMTSDLADIFAPVGDPGQNQVVASPALVGLSARQVYNYRYYKTETSFTDYIVNSKKWPGDLRLYSVTASQRGVDINKTLHHNMILKFNVNEENDVFSMDEQRFFNRVEYETNNIILDRPEHVYLRFAEALMGLEREGWTGAKELAMTVLGTGVKKEYKIYWEPDTVIKQRVDEVGRGLTADLLDADGKVVKLIIPVLDENGAPVVDEETGEPLVEEIVQKAPVMAQIVESEYEPLTYDFSDNAFSGNIGIHSRGSGFTESNPYYALTDSCVAMYHNIDAEDGVTAIVQNYEYNDDGSIRQLPVFEDEEQTTYKLDENGNVVYEFSYTEPVEVKVYNVTDELRIEYMYDKLIDEMALEMAWEGHRFGDLARMATALANPEFLAKRVAARNVSDADWRTAEGAMGWDAALYSKLRNKNNWYMPLPDNYLVPTIVPVTPDKPFVPEEGEEETSIYGSWKYDWNDPDGEYVIYHINADGTGYEQIMNAPSLSPDDAINYFTFTVEGNVLTAEYVNSSITNVVEIVFIDGNKASLVIDGVPEEMTKLS